MKQLFLSSLFILLLSCSGEKPQKENVEKNSEAQQETVTEKSAEQPVKVVAPATEMVYFEGGTFMMGSENGLPNEAPVHEVNVEPFYIDKSPVTVAQFRQFVEVTGFKTEAEKFGDS